MRGDDDLSAIVRAYNFQLVDPGTGLVAAELKSTLFSGFNSGLQLFHNRADTLDSSLSWSDNSPVSVSTATVLQGPGSTAAGAGRSYLTLQNNGTTGAASGEFGLSGAGTFGSWALCRVSHGPPSSEAVWLESYGGGSLGGPYGYVYATAGAANSLASIEAQGTSGTSYARATSTAGSPTGVAVYPYLQIQGGSDAAGNIRFDAANPYITAPSYIVIPGGAYFNSGTVYCEAQMQARGGVNNDQAGLALSSATGNIRLTGTALITGWAYVDTAGVNPQCFRTDSQTAGGAWYQMQHLIYSGAGGGNQSGLGFNSNGAAAVLRNINVNGNRLDTVDGGGAVYAPHGASAFVVSSALKFKQDVEPCDDDELLQRIARVRAHRYRLRHRPTSWRPPARFVDINDRWTARGKTPLRARPETLEAHEHDCSIDGCAGTADSPCNLTVNDTPVFGVIAEHVHEHLPEVSVLGGDNLPEGVEVNQLAAMAFGGVGALLRKLDELTKRVAELEAR